MLKKRKVSVSPLEEARRKRVSQCRLNKMLAAERSKYNRLRAAERRDQKLKGNREQHALKDFGIEWSL